MSSFPLTTQQEIIRDWQHQVEYFSTWVWLAIPVAILFVWWWNGKTPRH